MNRHGSDIGDVVRLNRKGFGLFTINNRSSQLQKPLPPDTDDRVSVLMLFEAAVSTGCNFKIAKIERGPFTVPSDQFVAGNVAEGEPFVRFVPNGGTTFPTEIGIEREPLR